MAQTKEDLAFLKSAYARLSDAPLVAGEERFDQFYEPIYSQSAVDDPVATLSKTIELSDSQSIQLFSGFSGSGKTTELFRLKRELEKADYIVLYANALEYVNPAEPIDISDLLIVLAGAFGQAIKDRDGIDPAFESFWDRLKHFLTSTELQVSHAGLSAEARSPLSNVVGGLKAGIDLRAELKTASSFRQDLRRILSNRLAELTGRVCKFFEDGVKALRNLYGAETQIVFIFDQLEQMRGTFETEQAVIASLDRVFSSHIDLLKVPYVHMVYTVPPWMKFVGRLAVPMRVLSTVHLWHNDAERRRNPECWEMFRSVVRRRLGEDGLMRVFGNPDGDGSIDQVIAMCGGHIRDLLRMLRDMLVRAPALPVTAEVVTAAINGARREFLPLSLEDARRLDRIATTRISGLGTNDPEEISRLSRLIDHHAVLYFTNGDDWYDVHPLLRDEIGKVLVASGEAAS